MNVFYISFMDSLTQTMFYSSITFFALGMLSTFVRIGKHSPFKKIQAGFSLIVLLAYVWNILLVSLFFILNIF